MNFLYKNIIFLVLLLYVCNIQAQVVSFFSDPPESSNAGVLDLMDTKNTSFDATCSCMLLKKDADTSYVDFIYMTETPKEVFLKTYVSGEASIFISVNDSLIMGFNVTEQEMTEHAFIISPEDLTGIDGHPIRIEILPDSPEDLKVYMVTISSDPIPTLIKDTELAFLHLPLGWVATIDTMGLASTKSSDGNIELITNTHTAADVAAVEADIPNIATSMGVSNYSLKGTEVFTADDIDPSVLVDAKTVISKGTRNGEEVGLVILMGKMADGNILSLSAIMNKAGYESSEWEDLQQAMFMMVNVNDLE
ncbi:MAG: hypothetical protein AB8B69_06395 [Chitinophagales bacterium]